MNIFCEHTHMLLLAILSKFYKIDKNAELFSTGAAHKWRHHMAWEGKVLGYASQWHNRKGVINYETSLMVDLLESKKVWKIYQMTFDQNF